MKTLLNPIKLYKPAKIHKTKAGKRKGIKMNTTQKIAIAGLTGLVGLTLGMAPATAAPKDDSGKGNSVSQAAHAKEKGESNKEAAHAHAPGQVKKAEAPAPVETIPAPAPVETTPAPAPVEETPAPAPVEETPAPAPVEETPSTDAPADDTTGTDDSVEEAPATDAPSTDDSVEDAPSTDAPATDAPAAETTVVLEGASGQ